MVFFLREINIKNLSVTYLFLLLRSLVASFLINYIICKKSTTKHLCHLSFNLKLKVMVKNKIKSLRIYL